MLPTTGDTKTHASRTPATDSLSYYGSNLNIGSIKAVMNEMSQIGKKFWEASDQGRRLWDRVNQAGKQVSENFVQRQAAWNAPTSTATSTGLAFLDLDVVLSHLGTEHTAGTSADKPPILDLAAHISQCKASQIEATLGPNPPLLDLDAMHQITLCYGEAKGPMDRWKEGKRSEVGVWADTTANESSSILAAPPGSQGGADDSPRPSSACPSSQALPTVTGPVHAFQGDLPS